MGCFRVSTFRSVYSCVDISNPKIYCRIRRLQLPAKSRQIYFGQLLGMCDHLSFTLGTSPMELRDKLSLTSLSSLSTIKTSMMSLCLCSGRGL